jgi:hypothetical protein
VRRGVTKADLEEIRRRVPAPRVAVLITRTIIHPQRDGSPPVTGPRTAMHDAMIAAAWEAIRADGKNRRLILDDHADGCQIDVCEPDKRPQRATADATSG